MLSTATQNLDCWIGLNDLETEGTYVWEDGSTSTYTNWSPGEPNNAGTDQHCAHTLFDGRWNDGSCGSGINCFYCSKIGKYRCGKCIHVVELQYK